MKIDGYVFEYEGKRNWRASSDERWEIVCTTLSELRRVGQRTIDGARCTVYRAPDGKFYAVVAIGEHS
jgi:hypothetical protein